MAAFLHALSRSLRGGSKRLPGRQPARVASARRLLDPCIQGSWPLALIAFSIFLLNRPYSGIVQDAYIYIGRALADLDPGGVGRDMIFVYDGQFGFSVFRPLAAALVALSGPAFAAKALALAAMAAWFWAALAFSRQFLGGRAVWAVLVFAALLPASYGLPLTLSFAEPLAIPRPFSEAFVLVALAELIRGRNGLSLLWLAAALLMHPIMALPGFCVFFFLLGFENKHWFWFCILGIAALILGGASGMPLLNRLFVPFEPSFGGAKEFHSPFIFPTRWPAESFSQLFVYMATLAVAARLLQGRRRLVLYGAALAGWGGIAMSAIFGDWLTSLLIVQLQPWRMCWLMSAAGAVAMGICVIKLWPLGPCGRIPLALLALSWLFVSQAEVAAPTAILAFCLSAGQERFKHLFTAKIVLAAWTFTVVAGAIWQCRLFAFPWQFSLSSPAGYASPSQIAVRYLLPLPACAFAAYFAIVKPQIPSRLRGAFAALLAVMAALSWDQRSPDQQMAETGRPPEPILQLVDRRKGEVLWMDGLGEAWFLFHRPQWASLVQAGPRIFSPALAAEWYDRMGFLMRLRLANQSSFKLLTTVVERKDKPWLSQEGLEQLCARKDAPAWIITPLKQRKEPPAGIPMMLWKLPAPHFRLAKDGESYFWEEIEAYGILPCAAQLNS
ncbi:MAG: hypothetical protein J2P49_03165 [Methylocapsa sp.]|nr:hypothetical protein [Methylocapsa sp.]